MTSMWRTSGWVLVGSALILALSLGVRHGFGLFLPPMSAEEKRLAVIVFAVLLGIYLYIRKHRGIMVVQDKMVLGDKMEQKKHIKRNRTILVIPLLR